MKKLLLFTGLLLLGCCDSLSAAPVVLTITRQHSDNSCVSGQISLNGKLMGYTLERRWEGDIPLISSIAAGSYNGFVRTDTKDRWRIELDNVSIKDKPDRTNVQLHVGNFVADSLGGVLIGTNLTSDLCHLEGSKAAFDNFKLEFSKAAGGEPDKKVQITVIITDYSK